jgi:hypothetical protein
MDGTTWPRPSGVQTHSDAPAAITEKTQNETPQAHQETNKLSTAAISADEHRLTPATIAEDILASRELSFEHANDTPSDRVEPEADNHAPTKAIHSRHQDMPDAKNLELSMAAAAGERSAVARTPSPMQDC